MAGAMRKVGEYLGLVEQVEYDEAEPVAPVRPQATRQKLTAVPQAPTVSAPVVTAQQSVMSDVSRIETISPRTYNDARTIGEHYRDGVPVIMNLSDIGDADAKRLVDFAAGLVFATHGTISRITAKVFLLSPEYITVSEEDKQALVAGGFYNQS